MKSKYLINLVLLLSFLLCWAAAGEAIAQKKTRTRMKVYYEKLSNNNRKISMELTQGRGKNTTGVENAEIELSTFKDDTIMKLASVFTDANGQRELIIEAGYKFPLDEDGYAVINAYYIGNDSLQSARQAIKFLDLNVDIAFEVIDSVNHIIVSVYELDTLGKKKPVEGVDLNIGVERLYSILYLEKTETDDAGKGSLEFPGDIPGDSLGNVNIIVKITDNDDYGSLTKAAKVNWGTIVDYSDTGSGRSLFGDEAPMWMIIAVFIILAGAWFHFILAITRVLKMRKLAQEPGEQLETEI